MNSGFFYPVHWRVSSLDKSPAQQVGYLSFDEHYQPLGLGATSVPPFRFGVSPRASWPCALPLATCLLLILFGGTTDCTVYSRTLNYYISGSGPGRSLKITTKNQLFVLKSCLLPLAFFLSHIIIFSSFLIRTRLKYPFFILCFLGSRFCYRITFNSQLSLIIPW